MNFFCRRHICVQQRTITMPVKTTEVYARPIWKHVNTPCSAVQVQTQHPNQMCTRVQLVHEQTFRDVIRHKPSQQVTYDCCSGWEREFPKSDYCSKRKRLTCNISIHIDFNVRKENQKIYLAVCV